MANCGQRRRVDDFDQAAFDQSDERDPAVGDDFGDEVLAAFGRFAAEGEAGLLLDRGKHGQEAGGDGQRG